MNPRAQTEDRLCSSCRENSPLGRASFCSACLLAAATSSPRNGAATGANGHLGSGTIVGEYEIVELIGEGGFAEVYSAAPRDGAAKSGMPKRVALKVIKRGMDSREIVSRFRAEHRTIESLSHASIVGPLHAGLTEAGLPYFTMPQVDGLPVTDYCEIAQLSLRERLQLFLKCCEAMQHAHWKGVLHRDLKPSNILVEETEEGPVPRIIDFGIAKALEPTASGMTLVTQLGQVLGTPTYMSPEQAAGSDEADTRSDVYSLGTVLYEILTGCPPFNADALLRLPPQQWAGHLRQHPPAAPSARLHAAGGSAERVKHLKGSLDDVVRKAMALEPNERYRSAAALADDVRHYLEGRPVSAHPPSLNYVLKKFVARNRWPVAFAVAILAGIIASAAIGTVLAIQARRAEIEARSEQNRAVAAEQRASEARERSEHLNYQAAIETAMMHLENGQPYLAAERLRATPARLRGWEWGFVMTAVPQPEAAADTGFTHPGPLAASRDGEIAAVAEGKTLRVVDVRSNQRLAEHAFAARISWLAVSEDKLRVAVVETASEGDVLHVLRIGTNERWSAALGSAANIAWEPSSVGGALIAVSGNAPTPSPGRLVRFDPASGRVLNERVIERFKVPARSLFIGPAGHMAAVANSYKDLEIVSLPALETLSIDHDLAGDAADAVLLDDARDLLVVARGPRIYAGAASHSGRSLAAQLADAAGTNAAQVRRMNWLPDGRWLAAGETSVLVQGEQPQRIPASAASAVIPISGGRFLALLNPGRLEIRSAPLRSAQPFAAIVAGDDAEGRGTGFTPDSKRALFQSWRRDALQIVPLDQPTNASGTHPTATFARQPEAEWSALPVVHPDGSVLTRVDGGLVAIRDNGGEFQQVAIPRTEGIWSAAASGDGAHLAVGVQSGVRLFDWQTREIVREWVLPGGPFRVEVLKPRDPSQTVAVAALGRDSVLHHLPLNGEPVSFPLPLRTNGLYPAPIAFHSHSALLAGGLAEGGYAVYDLSLLPDAPRLLLNAASVPKVTALAFTPDARRLAIGTDDHRLSIWDWAQALPLLRLPLNSTCASVAFSPDGEWMANTDYAPSLVLRRASPLPPAR